MFHSIHLQNFLSFGPDTGALELLPLNLVIGPNGSGKSNLLEAFDLLRCAPSKLLDPIHMGGGVGNWLWKGSPTKPTARVEVVTGKVMGQQRIRYALAFSEVYDRFELVDERLENEKADAGHQKPYFFYDHNSGRPLINVQGTERSLRQEHIKHNESILSQRRDPEQYPEITQLAETFESIRLYREWHFGRDTVTRLPQRSDLRIDSLEPDCSNLGLALNRLRRDPLVKKRVLVALQQLYEGIDDYDVHLEGNTVQVFFQEGNTIIPATRLSNGTLRYLSLLTILCHPEPAPLLCIEEPELGLHPDMLPTVAELLKEASQRTQLIVTTHSEVLVDAMIDQPESVVVVERGKTGTSLTRLNADNLRSKYAPHRHGLPA